MVFGSNFTLNRNMFLYSIILDYRKAVSFINGSILTVGVHMLKHAHTAILEKCSEQVLLINKIILINI
jgi:hypothetical protein